MIWLLPFSSRIGAVQRLGVFGAQLEDVADFDAAADFQRALAVRRGVAGDDVAQIGDFRLRQVAAEIDAGQVEAGFVGAADKIAHRRDAAVGENGDFFAVDRTGPM
jgi:hypothetical protein